MPIFDDMISTVPEKSVSGCCLEPGNILLAETRNQNGACWTARMSREFDEAPCGFASRDLILTAALIDQKEVQLMLASRRQVASMAVTAGAT